MPSAAKTVTAEDLTDIPTPTDLQLAPNGEHVVYCLAPRCVKGEHKISAIWIAHVGLEGSARQLTSGIYNDTDPCWSPDGKSIAFISDRAEQGKSCAIYGLSFDGGEPYALTEIGNKQAITQVGWSPDGESIAFLSPDELSSEEIERTKAKQDVIVYDEHWSYNRLRMCDISTRKIKVVYKHSKHVRRFAWHSDSRTFVMILHHTPERDCADQPGVLRIMNIGSKKSKPFLKFPGPIGDSLAWLEDQIYFIGGHTPESVHSSQKGYIANSKTGEWSKYDEAIPSSVTDFRSTSRHIYVRKAEGLYTTLHLHGHVLFHCEEEILSWDAIETPNDETVVAVVLSSTDKPYEVYTLNAGVAEDGYAKSKDRPHQMSNHNGSIPRETLGTYQPLSCQSYDDTTALDGFYIAPANHDSSIPLKTIVFIHGGPYNRFTNAFSLLYHGFYPYLTTSSGYAILVPNYRGGCGRGEEFASAARAAVGTMDYDDILAMVDEGISQGLVDPDRVLIAGWSQGGFLASIAAVRNGRTTDGHPLDWRFQGAICGAPATDYDMLVNTSDAPAYETEMLGIAPWFPRKKGAVYARKANPLREIGAAKDLPPVLLLHGDNDARVPVTQSVAFHRGLRAVGAEVEFARYPREGHVFQEREHVIDMLERTRRFAERCLGDEG